MKLLLAIALAFGAGAASAQTAKETELLNRIGELEKRLAALEARLGVAQPAPAPSEPLAPAKDAELSPTGDKLSLPGFAAGTTLNFLFDGYYEYNFNHPAGRVNLLRLYDPTSNNLTVNQGVAIIERLPDPAERRWFGFRLDLMFGQATEALAGNPANEPRTAPYRNIYQAYGTMAVPVGKGLNVDFGRFSSPLGIEGSFAKDQINYTRSLLFTALPAYHTGVRAAYKINDTTTATWMLVNGLNQAEDFNGFKSMHFMLAKSLTKNLSWTGSYYVGRESRDIPQAAAPAIAPDGRTHIGDTYLSWNATSKLTLVGEGDYIASRAFHNSAPVHLAGVAGYAKYQVLPAFYLAGRYEYVSDHGGYLSGVTQALKEATLTASYQPVNGLQLRWEFRHDYSNRSFFLTRIPGVLRTDQNTALLGFLWWFGGKSGAW